MTRVLALALLAVAVAAWWRREVRRVWVDIAWDATDDVDWLAEFQPSVTLAGRN